MSAYPSVLAAGGRGTLQTPAHLRALFQEHLDDLCQLPRAAYGAEAGYTNERMSAVGQIHCARQRGGAELLQPAGAPERRMMSFAQDDRLCRVIRLTEHDETNTPPPDVCLESLD